MQVAVLGTGIMGAGMARSLLRDGHEVCVWNRNRERAEPLAAVGARVADSPAEAVRDARVVLTSLHDLDAVLAVAEDAFAGDVPDVVWLQVSTVGPDGTARLAELAERVGVVFLDAPVLGTRQPAENGALTVLAAGPADAITAVDPVLSSIGAKTLVTGEEPGSASAVKLACNAWVASLTAATAQSIALVEDAGLDPTLFLEAIAGTATDSAYAQTKGPAMIAGSSETAFAVSGLVKDLGLIRNAAAASGTDATLLDALAALYTRADDAGHSADDIAAVRSAF